MEHFLQTWGYAAVFVLALAEAICIPFPSEITFGFGGALAAEGHFALAAVILVGIAGEFIGSLIGFAAGRTGGHALVTRYGKYVLISPDDLERAHRFLASRNDWSVAVGRALPLVRTFVSIVAGIAEMSVARFSVFTLIGTSIYSAAVAGGGYALGTEWHKLAKGFTAAGFVLLGLAVVALAAFFVHRWRVLKGSH
jgi:membrane protein DedA with SNARE-associated domain